jgi:nicotinate-nucleotide--dimethylbenzimidazole phosphoribosyltransferase
MPRSGVCVSESESGSSIAAAARRAIDEKTKPVGSLGELEAWAARLCVAQRTLLPRVDRARIIVFAGDHGVAAEKVSAYPSEVTAQMMVNYSAGGAAINTIARANGIELEVIDVGVDADLSRVRNIVPAKVRRGTGNIVSESAMSDSECVAAMEVGRAAVSRASGDGIRMIGLGEMGIANTTAAAAVLSALSGRDPDETTGRGTGINDVALVRKRAVVRAAVKRHQNSEGRGAELPQTVLRGLGGLEIAAITGAALEAASRRVIVIADGFISTVGVLIAVRIDPAVAEVLFVAHRSSERGHSVALEELRAQPMLDLGMRLGEGSGAAVAMPLLRAAASIMSMATFDAASVSTAVPPA